MARNLSIVAVFVAALALASGAKQSDHSLHFDPARTTGRLSDTCLFNGPLLMSSLHSNLKLSQACVLHGLVPVVTIS